MYFCKIFWVEELKFVLIKKIGNNIFEVKKVKKILISALLLAIGTSMTAEANTYRYQTTQKQTVEFSKPIQKVPQQTQQLQQQQQETVFSQSTQNYSSDTTSIEKTVTPPKIITKELKNKYKDISKNERIIEACELLKNGAGNFSYRSIHGNNKTLNPIVITFSNISKDKNENKDAYGEFTGKKYKININSKFEDAPAAALAPIIAREALVSKEKNESDIEAAEQLQIAVWTQMLQKNPALLNSQNQLAKMQNKLKQSGNIQEYGAFLQESKPIKPTTSAPPKEITRAFGKGQATQENFDYKKQAEGEKISSEIMSYDSKELQKKYKKVTKEDRIIEALELLKDSVGKFSHDAILGKNDTHKPISIKFKNLSEINPKYASFDALGWQQAGRLNIFINSKHADAPAAAIAALLAHEALHQDKFDSLNEETYAWTMEASVWVQMCDREPSVSEITHPLVARENLLKKLLEKGNYTNKYIKKSVFSNPSYSNLPVRSPGFENDI